MFDFIIDMDTLITQLSKLEAQEIIISGKMIDILSNDDSDDELMKNLQKKLDDISCLKKKLKKN